MKSITEKLQHFFDVGVMAIIRIDSQENINPTIEALMEGGIDIIEISLVTPHALEHIARIHDEYGDQVLL